MINGEAECYLGTGDVIITSGVIKENNCGMVFFATAEKPHERGIIPVAEDVDDVPIQIVMTFPDIKSVDILLDVLNVMKRDMINNSHDNTKEEIKGV